MTRFIHDQFAKEYLTELLSGFGQVEADKKLTPEVQEIDLLFLPDETSTRNKENLGILGQLINQQTLFEPFRNPVSAESIRSCLSKVLEIEAQLNRENKREKTKLKTKESAFLWILTPTASLRLIKQFTPELKQLEKGIYLFPDGYISGLIVIHQLERKPETLWLRILGRGQVQQQAMAELTNLTPDNPFRETTLELVYNLLAVLEARQQKKEKLEPEEVSLIMKLSPVYLQRLEEATNKGIEQGIERGIEQGIEQERRQVIESLMVMRFGSIDSQLEALIETLIRRSASEFTPLILELSKEELIERFRVNN